MSPRPVGSYWRTWLTLTVVALGFVAVYGNRTPRLVGLVVRPLRDRDRSGLSTSWLWENVQGHRWPIMKLVFVACYSLFGFNSKPILYLNVVLFSALALGLLWAIRKAAVDGAIASPSCRSFSSILVKPRRSPGPRSSPIFLELARRRC